MSYSESVITFLDVKITKNEDGSLSSGLYRKSTAENTILHATSAHPQPLVQLFPYSQYLRLRRNCSMEEYFHVEAGLLKERLLNQGYSRMCLKKAFKRAVNLGMIFSSSTKRM